MKISFYRYVPLGFVHAFEKAGWVATPALRGTHHGDYSELMEWRGEGEPVSPRMEAA